MSQTRFELYTRPVGPWPVNTFVLRCPNTRQSVLIDPGADPETLLEMLEDSQPIAILLTHSHPDHIGALEEMRERLEVPVMAHPGPHWEGMPLEIEAPLRHGDKLPLGTGALTVYHTPGHIDDLLCYALWDEEGQGDPRVIVGDAIFEGGPGKTWSAEGFQRTLRTLREVILRWPDEAYCYPGHGPAFRLGDQRAEIEAFIAREHGDFFGDATWDLHAEE